MTCRQASRRAHSKDFCRMIVVIWERRFSLKNDVTKSMNDIDKNVSRMMRLISTIEQLSINFTLRDNHRCAELSSISRAETETETKTNSWMRSSSMTTSDSEKFWFEMLSSVELRTLVNESTRSDWDETCLLLFTNNALLCSGCAVPEFREIRGSVGPSWIFALLALANSIRCAST